MTLGATEFLRRFFLHVLPKGFVRIRHFGLLANRFRASHLALGRHLLGPSPSRLEVQPQQVQSESSSLWHCPRCGASMVVIHTTFPRHPFMSLQHDTRSQPGSPAYS